MTHIPWRDTTLTVTERVTDLIGRMTIEEKAHQLVGYWVAQSAGDENVAPHQDQFSADARALDEVTPAGLGQLTRVYGTAPTSPRDGLSRLRALQSRIAAANRFGVPAIAHEECLTGFATHSATIFPTPLSWGASFDPGLVEEMAAAIGKSLRRMGVHQGLAPVLDVTRDYRWGRTEETIGEDPYLVGLVGAAYVRGLEDAGVVATLKHFAGYSASRAGRNHAPVAIGPREFADVLVEPFAMALELGRPRAVMASYCDVDGVPSTADVSLLTGLLRERLGFDGIVVSDYFGISFLETMHAVAGSPGAAAALALRAGVDVELPTVRCYGQPLVQLVESGEMAEALLDRAAERVLRLKCELGLLDPDWDQELDADGLVDLDPPEHRSIARRLAESSVVVLENNGILPLPPAMRRLAVVGPLGDDPLGMLGCYTFPRHVGSGNLGVHIPTLADALRKELPDADLVVELGCGVDDEEHAGLSRAVDAARAADVCILALGDRSGLFGRGTSGEGSDASTLALPGRQAELAAAVLATGTPTVVMLLAGRPYALGDIADRAAAVVLSFFPGEEGGTALAGVLSGRVEPSGRLPVSVPRDPGGQPGTYLRARLAGETDVSSVDPTPRYPFGHGLTWTRFAYRDLAITADAGHPITADAGQPITADAGQPITADAGQPIVGVDGSVTIAVTVTNVGDRAGTEVVQLYLGDPVASVVRPERWLAGFARVRLEPGAAARVSFALHADRVSFTGPRLTRIVEPGVITVAVGPSSAVAAVTGEFRLRGETRELGRDRVLHTPVDVRLSGRAGR